MIGDPTIKESAVKALQEIVNGQNPSGGFNYNLVPGERDDTSYMAWCAQALSAGKHAGLSEEVVGLDRAMAKAVDGFRGNYGEGEEFGGFGYTRPSVSSALSGAGAFSMQLLGEAKGKEVRKTLPMIARSFPFNWENPKGSAPLYYWYYNTQAFFQEGSPAWAAWNQQFSPGLVEAQSVTGSDSSGYVDHNGHPQEIGYWTSPSPREFNGGNGEVMDTILCTLMLEVYYRYLPAFQQIPEDGKADATVESSEQHSAESLTTLDLQVGTIQLP